MGEAESNREDGQQQGRGDKVCEELQEVDEHVQGGAGVPEIVLYQAVSSHHSHTAEKFDTNINQLISHWDNRAGGHDSGCGGGDDLAGAED